MIDLLMKYEIIDRQDCLDIINDNFSIKAKDEKA